MGWEREGLCLGRFKFTLRKLCTASLLYEGSIGVLPTKSLKKKVSKSDLYYIVSRKNIAGYLI
jgi:hypothetical protein